MTTAPVPPARRLYPPPPPPRLTHWGPAGELHRGTLDACLEPVCAPEPSLVTLARVILAVPLILAGDVIRAAGWRLYGRPHYAEALR